jgi:hypothetical protein
MEYRENISSSTCANINYVCEAGIMGRSRIMRMRMVTFRPVYMPSVTNRNMHNTDPCILTPSLTTLEVSLIIPQYGCF